MLPLLSSGTGCAVARVRPVTCHGMFEASYCCCSILGRIVQLSQRKSSPNQLTIRDVAPQLGSSPVKASSAVAKSDLPDGELTLAKPDDPAPKFMVTGVVARVYSPLPGRSATARRA